MVGGCLEKLMDIVQYGTVKILYQEGNIFEAPESFKLWLPDNVVLDGELFLGRQCFENVVYLEEKYLMKKMEKTKSSVSYF